MILVKVRVDEKPKEYIFMLDTAAFSVISQEMARELGVSDRLEVEGMSTGGGKTKIHLATLEKMSVGRVAVKNIGIGIFDFSPIEQLTGVKMDGILGSNFLRHFRVSIDYENKLLVLSQKPNEASIPSGAIRMKFEQELKSGFAPNIGKVKVANLTLDGLIDTGARDCMISLKNVSELEKGSLRYLKARGATGGGAFGLQQNTRLLWADSINIGSLKVAPLPVLGVEQRKEYNDKFLLGKSFLARYLITIDYPANELILEPKQSEKAEIRPFSTGLTVRRETTGAISVLGFWEGSPADRAGLSPGDEIVKVNSRNIEDVSLADLNKLLRDDAVESLDMVVKKFKIERTVILKKEILLMPAK